MALPGEAEAMPYVMISLISSALFAKSVGLNGACRVLNITEDFDEFIPLDDFKDNYYTDELKRMSTIIEIDYYENKLNYNHNQTEKQKELDIVDNPVVEILFSEDDNPRYSYRLVLGAKLNRLAYIETAELKRVIKYNNYSPDLPSWPFAINVTVDTNASDRFSSKLKVYTRNGDGFDKKEPFLNGSSEWIEVNYMSIRNRNKKFKLVGFYGCSTKYGPKCGTEVTETIEDCRAKYSPVGNGFFQNFVKMSQYNALEKDEYNYDQIFGIYRRRNDNTYLLFTSRQFETAEYIRITIGDDEISIHIRTYNATSAKYHDRKAIRKGWTRREPSEPNFIRVILSSVSKNISIHDHSDNSIGPLILTMKLCDFGDSIKYMSVTSDGFKTVDLYYDCCVPSESEYCHVYEKANNQTNSSSAPTTDSHENIPDSSTIRLDEEGTTTFEPTQADTTTILTENISSTILESAGTTRSHGNISDSTTVRQVEETEGTTMLNENNLSTIMESAGVATETVESDEDDSLGGFFQSFFGRRRDEVELNEVETFESGQTKTNTFLNTNQFEETGSTQYEYEDGISPDDYCPHELSGVTLMRVTTEAIVEADEDEDDVNPLSYTGNNRGGLNTALLAKLVG
ncbi:hypothetical protein HA402_009797 [Bradysia odoriphaga]|nr:hypothetical protein HA402_009797 [Bradysia odoriphaga]